VLKYLQTLTWLAVALMGTWVSAQTLSPVQSPARPYNLDIASPVMMAGSDELSLSFQQDVLPGLQGLINQNLSQRTRFNHWDAVSVNPTLLTLTDDTAVRVYFLGENSRLNHSLGYSTEGGTPLDPSAQLIFPDATSGPGLGGGMSPIRTADKPLRSGDFVDIGNFQMGQVLDFFLIANGANGGTRFFSTDQSNNADGIFHAISFMREGLSYMAIGFEDTWRGGDMDLNDVMFVVGFSAVPEENEGGGSSSGVGAPEPSMALGGLLALGILTGFVRRRNG
jgi:hypothetical protein